MSINSGLFAGVAAVASQATNFAVISDNIANASTVGFKDSDVQFKSLVTQSLSTSATAGGVSAITVLDPEKQGLLQSSSSATDIAIDGNGFFVVNGSATPTVNDEYLLTRAGSFKEDENDRLRNAGGYYLQGYLTNSDGSLVNQTTKGLLSSLESVDLSKFKQVAKPTTQAEIFVNLDSREALNQNTSRNFLTVYDSLGNNYLMRLTWTRNAANTYRFSADLVDPLNAATTVPGNPDGAGVGAFQTIVFNADGTPNTIGGAAGATGTAMTSSIVFLGGNAVANGIEAAGGNFDNRVVDNITINVNFGNFDQPTGVTQYASAFSEQLLSQDGSGPTSLTSVNFDNQGKLTALFANGSSRIIYQLPVGTVPAANKLEGVTGNAFRVTANSGDTLLNLPTEGGTGRISSSALESSTVDIAQEFTDLIITQRAYGAATKIISTGDQLLDEIIRVKR